MTPKTAPEVGASLTISSFMSDILIFYRLMHDPYTQELIRRWDGERERLYDDNRASGSVTLASGALQIGLLLLL